MRVMDTVIVEKAPQELQSAVLCAIWRECNAPISEEQVHANAYASLNLVLQGAVEISAARIQAPSFVTGPFTRPLVTSVRGPLRSVCLVFQPWLLPAVFGLQPSSLTDRIHPLEAAPVCAQAIRWLDVLRCSCPGEASFWQRISSAVPTDSDNFVDAFALTTLRTQGLGAAARAAGLGERQYRRIFLHRTGLSPKTWERLQRFDALAQGLTEGTSLSALAASAGYADQAHMSRESKSIANHSPAKLRAGLARHQPALWALRPAEVRFVQDREGDVH